jgi:hypothetical protein
LRPADAALVRAAARGDRDGIDAALASGADIAARGNYALLSAARLRDAELADFLRARGAPALAGADRMLWKAIYRNRADMAELALACGANRLAEREEFEDELDSDELKRIAPGEAPGLPRWVNRPWSPLAGRYRLFGYAVECGRLDIARLILARLPELRDDDSWPLMTLFDADEETRRILLAKPWRFESQEDAMLAGVVTSGSIEDLGAAITAGLSPDGDKGEGLTAAIACRDLAKLDLLIGAGADIERKGGEAMLEAVRRRDPAMIEALVARGMPIFSDPAPLVLAVRKTDRDMVSALLRSGADIDAGAGAALAAALLDKNAAMVGELLDQGADPDAGPEILDAALFTEGNDMILALLEAGMDESALIARALKLTEKERGERLIPRVALHLPLLLRRAADSVTKPAEKPKPDARPLPRHKRDRIHALRSTRRALHENPPPDAEKPASPLPGNPPAP